MQNLYFHKRLPSEDPQTNQFCAAINRLVYHQTSYQTRSRIFQLASYVVRWRGRAYCHVIRYCYYYKNILKALLHNEDGRAWIIPGDVVLNNGSVMVLAAQSITVSGALHHQHARSSRKPAHDLSLYLLISRVFVSQQFLTSCSQRLALPVCLSGAVFAAGDHQLTEGSVGGLSFHVCSMKYLPVYCPS